MPTPVITPIAEVCDRWTIAKLKQKYKAGDPAELQRQVDYYAAGIDWDRADLMKLLDDLYEINALQWSTEDALRTGEMDECDLAEIGRLALRVRNLNRTRCTVKNRITELMLDGFMDVKVGYGMGAEVGSGMP
jgi:hypothetical protein